MSLEGTQKKEPKFVSGPHLLEEKKKEKKKVSPLVTRKKVSKEISNWRINAISQQPIAAGIS